MHPRALEKDYLRLLGYRPGERLRGREAGLAAAARTWYAEHGEPWIHWSEWPIDRLGTSAVRLAGGVLSSKTLARRLREARAHALTVVAVSAGPAVDAEVARLWAAERLDESFFLDAFASAFVEHLMQVTRDRLSARFREQELAVLPHYSPGYDGWSLTDQSVLLQLLRGDSQSALPGDLRVLSSGMLTPKKSMLAVFGLTRVGDGVTARAVLVPCTDCSFASCTYRRVPVGRPT